MKKTNILCLSMIILGVTGCGGNNNQNNHPTSITIDKNTYYGEIQNRVSFDNENPVNFNQSMENGLDDDVFYAIDGAWHTDQGFVHGGVKKRNLYYSSDGEHSYLLMKARGSYNKEDPEAIGKPEGACIITQNHLGPGRYEIDMAAMPREGAVTAFWTYCTTTGSEKTSQNEIDIEIGGSTNGTQFENMWCTTWTKKENKDTDTVLVTDQLYMNDGRIHKYTFDWYTNYMGTGVKRVDWFIDGILIKSIEGEVVPEHETPLWIGIWFPPYWAGNPYFNEDYLIIENISYTAFDHSQYFDSCRANPSYVKTKPSDANIQTIDFTAVKNVNKLANGDFESLDTAIDKSYYGWSIDEASKGSVQLVEGQNGKAFALKAGTKTNDDYYGEYLYQTISNAYPGFKYKLKIDAKLLDNASSGVIEIYYKGIAGNTIKKEVINVDSTDFKTYEKDIVMIDNSKKLQIDITSEDGTVIYDNASLVYLGN